MKKYQKLKTQYPEYISLDQVCIICKIAKRSARYLVVNNIIPAIDTGRKTWSYKIAIDDVTSYLQRRDKEGSMIPVGATSSRRSGTIKRFYAQMIVRGQEREIAKYFSDVYAHYPDVLDVNDMATMIGLCKKTILCILKNGHIKLLANKPKYIVPKIYFWDFVTSRRFIDARSNSNSFIRILAGFEEWLYKK